MSSPVSIDCSDQPLDLSFHPTRSTLVAAALVDGTVEVHDFKELLEEGLTSNNHDEDDDDDEADTILSSTPVHTQLIPSKLSDSGSRLASCRAIHFAQDGSSLFSGGTAGDLVCLDSTILCTFATKASPKSLLWRAPDASFSKSPMQVIHEIDNSLLVTGDDAGAVRLWDRRLCGSSLSPSNIGNAKKLPRGCVHGYKVHEDYISGLTYASDHQTLLASSADSTLSVYDLRMVGQQQQQQQQAVRRSDDQEDELLSIVIMKNGRKVVCGTGEGVLAVWSWGTWGDVSDRFPGHPASVDALLKVDENTLLTGSSDGLIRVVSIQPDKLLGVLGDHQGFPIEKLAFNADKHYVGSVSHDNLLRVWDARILDDDGNDDEDEEDVEGDNMKVTSLAEGPPLEQQAQHGDSDWDDMDEDMEEDSDDDDDSDTKGKSKNDKRGGHFKSANEKFFEDL